MMDLNGDGLVDSTDWTFLDMYYWGWFGRIPFDDGLVTHPTLESYREPVAALWGATDICPIGHQGLYQDKETDTTHNRARTLRPRDGRFNQTDPGPGRRMGVGAGGAAPVAGVVPMGPTGQYADGPNLYQYVRSNPVNGLDPTGLWKIERKGEARTIATAEKSDTLGTLAKAIYLDAKEFPLWGRGEIRVDTGATTWYIHNWSTKMATDDAINTKVCPGEKVSVPNTAYIDVSTYTWGALGWGLMAMKSGVSDVWTNQGLRVVYTNKWNTSKQAILTHLQADDIYTYLYIGHGAAGCMSGLDDSHVYNDGEYWNGSEGILTAGKYTKYGIADLGIIACWSYDSKDEWRKNVASLGVTRLVKGTMRAWNIKDFVVTVP